MPHTKIRVGRRERARICVETLDVSSNDPETCLNQISAHINCGSEDAPRVCRPAFSGARTHPQSLDGAARKNVSAKEGQNKLRHRSRMGGLEAVVAHGTGRCKPKVKERRPSFKLVVSIAVPEIGSANRRSCRCSFNRQKGGVVVHNLVRKENFLPAAASHVQRREIIEGARGANARE